MYYAAYSCKFPQVVVNLLYIRYDATIQSIWLASAQRWWLSRALQIGKRVRVSGVYRHHCFWSAKMVVHIRYMKQVHIPKIQSQKAPGWVPNTQAPQIPSTQASGQWNSFPHQTIFMASPRVGTFLRQATVILITSMDKTPDLSTTFNTSAPWHIW